MEHAHHMAIPMFVRVHQVSQELTVSVSTPASLWRAHKTFFTIIGFMGRYVSKVFSSYQLDKFIQIYSSLRLHLHYTGYSLKKCSYLTMNTCSHCNEECHRNLFNMCWYNFKTMQHGATGILRFFYRDLSEITLLTCEQKSLRDGFCPGARAIHG